MDEIVDQIRVASQRIDQARFLELLRWHRVVAGLPELDWSQPGVYTQAVTELTPERAAELLRDAQRAGRDLRGHRRGADGKPQFRQGRTLRDRFS
ncbi:hypothetical protein [Rhodococcus yananensis]|uniref:hypothetical protein n=1 Tax=Rhodococcus yananensis TaxID=2879464 RepID=UPI001CF90F1F|nr:hypothetical protein [Rhodococcus yananensis]